jgi:rod shape-determining protein MreD
MNWPRIISVLVVAYVAVFAQSRFLFLRHTVGAQVDLLPALLVYAGLCCSLPLVVTAAVTGGLWLDALSANPLGVSMIPLAAAGLLCHAYRDVILRDDFGTQLSLGFAASAGVPLATLGLLILVGADPLYGGWFVWRWLVSAALGAAFTPLFFLLFSELDRALSYRPETTLSYRPDREIDRGRDAHVPR